KIFPAVIPFDGSPHPSHPEPHQNKVHDEVRHQEACPYSSQSGRQRRGEAGFAQRLNRCSALCRTDRCNRMPNGTSDNREVEKIKLKIGCRRNANYDCPKKDGAEPTAPGHPVKHRELTPPPHAPSYGSHLSKCIRIGPDWIATPRRMVHPEGVVVRVRENDLRLLQIWATNRKIDRPSHAPTSAFFSISQLHLSTVCCSIES